MASMPLRLALCLGFGLAGCSGLPSEEPAAEPALTAEQQAAYEDCLQANMAVATAWELIEAQCLEEATGKSPTLEP